jgi:hypothetical protein
VRASRTNQDSAGLRPTRRESRRYLMTVNLRWFPPRFGLQIPNAGSQFVCRLRPAVFRSANELVATIRQFLDDHNRYPRRFIWTNTADQILERAGCCGQRTSDSGHWEHAI